MSQLANSRLVPNQHESGTRVSANHKPGVLSLLARVGLRSRSLLYLLTKYTRTYVEFVSRKFCDALVSVMNRNISYSIRITDEGVIKTRFRESGDNVAKLRPRK